MGIADGAAKSAAKAVAKFVAQKFWPWFLEHIWPLISAAVIALVAERITGMAAAASAAVESKLEARAARAREQAASSDLLAAKAVSANEREKHEAAARAWHEIALQLQADNEQLMQQISALEMVQQDAAALELQSLKPELDTDGERISLCISGTCTPLPALPSGGALSEA